MEITFLTIDDILYFHEKVLEQTPLEDKGLAPDTSLESAIERIDNHINFNNLSNLFDIAALYGEVLAAGAHCFANGNKRTALTSIISFLEYNDALLNVDEKRASDMIVLLANKMITREELSLWLKFHTSYSPKEQYYTPEEQTL
ncbi:type II toxin-antitoxin system death-on-curing family toxin [Legionella pneumophila]|uniref:type II toxin-antitoxin system death-on-curing family toxin n=1 Tax=Legionella pneumophila TaxID=446 RepID=UPI00067F3371|nr:type II toxin-antitoxin system death-on-curing family toxin [Legionella pneumophila]RYW90308.1 type II toxin-antitoxin system death-on-curing family toxin [Legionella pneumophila]STY00334.1 prophage maintenance system killer protein [Legionella pneumophila]HAT1775046.1 type II toxin-antitoxin system death-on-curing family toxin [Legionella pneumophila]HAT1778389.1 type II toxin-antitoxin system death-on-curing family toxin [Legionella pneumophila]HAT2018913.1 type II toxin-antitoxin system 